MKSRRVCIPRTKGGLGVRDIRLVNLSLLVKWRWKVLDDNGSLWKRVLEDKYGEHVVSLVDRSGITLPRIASNWWKNLMYLEGNGCENWFKREVMRKLGHGLETSF